jgi:hypothetical protein
MRSENKSRSNPNYVDLIKLIRSIQRAEGNLACYRRGVEVCDRLDCVWRDHCLKAPEGPSKAASELGDPKKPENPKQA